MSAFLLFFFSALLVGLPLLFFSILGIDAYISWMNALSLTSYYTKEFLSITIYLIPIYLSKNVIVSSLMAASNAKIPFYVKIFSTILNLALGYTLIHGIEGFNKGLGVVGAAYSNLIIAFLELALLALAVSSKKVILKFTKKFRLFYMKRAILLGYPSGVEKIFNFFALILITKFLVKFGDEILAGLK